MPALAAEVLQEWREAERLLSLLAPADVDRQAVADSLHGLQTLYGELTRSTRRPPPIEALSREQVARTRELLRETWARLDATD